MTILHLSGFAVFYILYSTLPCICTAQIAHGYFGVWIRYLTLAFPSPLTCEHLKGHTRRRSSLLSGPRGSPRFQHFPVSRKRSQSAGHHRIADARQVDRSHVPGFERLDVEEWIWTARRRSRNRFRWLGEKWYPSRSLLLVGCVFEKGGGESVSWMIISHGLQLE